MADYDPDLRGVGGWLAFFLVTLGIVNPLTLAVTGYQTLGNPEIAAAYGDIWPTLRNAELGIMVLLVGVCWYSCWRFLNLFNRTTVWIGIAALWTLALVTVFGEPYAVSVIAGLDFGELLTSATGAENVRPFGYATIWTLYLLRSKRVRSTYGPEQGEAVGEVFE